MNIRKGLIRVCIVISVLWIAGAGLHWSNLIRPSVETVTCPDAGFENSEPSVEELYIEPARMERIRSACKAAQAEADAKSRELNANRNGPRLYTDFEISGRTEVLFWPPAFSIGKFALITLGPPLGLAVAWFIIGWVVAGFRPD